MVSYRLSVRKMERGDIPYIVQWAGNKAVTRHFHIPLPQTEQEGNQWFQRSMIDRTRDDYLIYITEDEGKKYPIGMLGLCHIDDENRKAEYYVLIGNPEFLRRGIAYRTSGEMLNNCFKNMDFYKIYACVDKEHFEGQKLAEKLGFRKEGILQGDILLPDGTPVDRVYYGLLSG